jgi:hypothetical protein
MGALALLVVAAVAVVSPHEQALIDGRAAFDGFDLKRAEEGFTRAAAYAPTPGERAVALLWLGAVAAENGDFPGAKARFGDAVDLDVAVVVPEGLSPTIRQLVDEARRTARVAQGMTAVDEPLPPKPRWALLSGGAVAALGVLAVGGGAMVGIQAITQRDVASSLEFQDDAVAGYQKAKEGALWSNVLYGAGGVLVATGGGLAIASFLGADQP